MLIKYDIELNKCPVCSSALSVELPGSDKSTTCTGCDYTEPAGSPHYATFFGEVLYQYMSAAGVSSVMWGVEQVPPAYVVSPRGILPLLLARAQELIVTGYSSTALEVDVFRNIPDKSAILQQRVVLSGAQSSLPSEVVSELNLLQACATYCVDETLALSKLKHQTADLSKFQLGDIATVGVQLREKFPDMFAEDGVTEKSARTNRDVSA